MIKNKTIFFTGIFVFLIPFLGFPTSWKTFFTVISGLVLIILSIQISLPKRSTIKKLRRKEKTIVTSTDDSVMPKMEDIVIVPNEKSQSGEKTDF